MSSYSNSLKKEIKFLQWSIKWNNFYIKELEEKIIWSDPYLWCSHAGLIVVHNGQPQSYGQLKGQLLGRYNQRIYLKQRLQELYKQIH